MGTLKTNSIFSLDLTSNFLDALWLTHFELPADTRYREIDACVLFIRNRIFQGHWYEVYDFIEFLLEHKDLLFGLEIDEFRSACNYWLERDVSAWRVVGNKVVRLTSEEEIVAVEEATQVSDEYTPVAIHVQRSLELMSDRNTPDYRNSIKESISAVESMCGIITGNAKATLGSALKQLEASGVAIHPALRGAFNQMYGYTSDAQGIRHGLGLTEEPNLDFEDAKFMLVSCSAFVNLLRARAPSAPVPSRAAGTSRGRHRARAQAKPPQTRP